MNEPDRIQHPVARLMSSRSGHFLLESGHHGSLWLDLELLCLDPAAVRPFAVNLAARLKPYDVEAVCGPLIEGAFVALMVASELGLTFTYAERLPQDPG
ncbi:MAG: phosphoribosyltransferase, partial [Anaerolineales bacterium]|nr:phosphoribosyltransferase [Anaerolineales bacterium]